MGNVREVFLDNLPKKGNTVKNIDWKNAVGLTVPFVYNDINGELEIIEYDKDNKRLQVRYGNDSMSINTCNLIKGALGGILKVRTSDFRINLSTKFKDEKRNITIINREYRKDKSGCDRKWYKYRCNKCGNEDWMVENDIITNNSGCNVCCTPPKKVVPEINSIWAKAPWMMRWISEEDAKGYTPQSNQKIDVTCPYCGKKKKVVIHSIFRKKSIGCTCGDGFSYPEKLMVNILTQLNIEFKVQYSDKWTKNRKYDFYIPLLNCIIETHGLQHYEEDRRDRSRTFEEEQENDKVKEQLAKDNGIENYIAIDCRKSELKYISENILKSKLNELFDLSSIDWIQADLYAIKSNKVKEVCDYWNNIKKEYETANDLAIFFGMSKAAIIKYLKKGIKLGWTNYDPKLEMKKGGRVGGKSLGKEVKMYKDDIFIGVFESCHDLDRKSEKLFGVKLDYRGISDAINKNKKYKGYRFLYSD